MQEKLYQHLWANLMFDTYVKKSDGAIMHFDIIVQIGTPDELVYQYGIAYLKIRGDAGSLSFEQCKFCHIEQLQAYMEKDIMQKGYYILEMQGC